MYAMQACADLRYLLSLANFSEIHNADIGDVSDSNVRISNKSRTRLII